MMPEWLSFVDITYVGMVALFGFAGLQKGFAGQVAHFITTLALAGFLFFAYPSIFKYFGQIFRNLDDTYMMWLILVGTAVLVLGLFLLVSKIFAGLLKAKISARTDKVLGFTVGTLRGIMAAILAMILLVMLGPASVYDKFRAKSYAGKLVCYELVPRVQPHLTRSALEERVDELREALLYQEEAGVLE